MRLTLLLASSLLLQAKAEIAPKFEKFDRVSVTCTVRTEIKTSNGRDSKYTLEMDLSAEVEKAEGEVVVFDCGPSSLKVSGTLNGKPVGYEWRRGGAEKGEKVAGIQKALEKGWKVTLEKKGVTVNEAAGELGDTFPLFNPGIFIGFAVPPPWGAVQIGKGWVVKDLVYPYFNGFTLRYSGALNFVDKDVAKVSAGLAFTKPENEVPIDMGPNVKGDGSAAMDYDLRSGRPVRGATSVKLSLAQGGLKREVTQVIEYEVRR